jgi:acetyl-CoA carboxylase biotin carboxyl carrier protein
MPENDKEDSKKNQDKVSELYELAVKEGFSELEYKKSGLYVRLKRRQKRAPQGPAGVNPPAQEPPARQAYPSVKAPLNGTFYRSPSPQHPPFVQEGTVVDQGAVLCLIDAMKVMNEIRAESKMKILRILVENGKGVSAGQDMFLIENAG